jgi:hypothetical protein
MSHFAQIDENNAVIQVIVAEQDVIDSGLFGPVNTWIQTSYNTRAGAHLLGGTPLRKNYAGIGFIYDAQRDAFIPPKPFASWIINETSCQWQAPTPMPVEEGKMFRWNEDNQVWEEATAPTVTL